PARAITFHAAPSIANRISLTSRLATSRCGFSTRTSLRPNRWRNNGGLGSIEPNRRAAERPSGTAPYARDQMKDAFVSLVVAVAAAATAAHGASAQPAGSQTTPDLVVVIAVDQFGSALFDKWRSRYKSGFKRMIDEGIAYSNAYQSHGVTETCPGHST